MLIFPPLLSSATSLSNDGVEINTDGPVCGAFATRERDKTNMRNGAFRENVCEMLVDYKENLPGKSTL